MCGIIAYVGQKNCAPIILNGLRRLEYRGYDSAGVATVGSDLQIRKDVGRVDQINSKLDFESMPGTIGFGHTRWATHGGVTQKNAHPHVSNNGKIAVIHNGIVENFQELKRFLQQNGFTFYSDTDTEVIPNLIEYEMKNGKNFVEATKLALKKIEGYYAVLALNSGERKIVASRRGSPLVVGIGDKETFLASDIPAFLDSTKNVMYLYDYDFIVADDSGISQVFNLKEWKPVERKIYKIDWDIEQAKKGNFDHFMMKEIMEQVDTVERAMKQDEKALLEISNDFKQAKGIFFVAAGTAYHACLAASYIFSRIAKMHINVVLSSEFKNYTDFLNSNTLVVAISQSGETIDTIEAATIAKEKTCKVISVVNVVGSSLTRHADKTLLINAGPEIGVLATKSYTSQVALLALLAYATVGKISELKNKLNFLENVIYYLTSERTRISIKELAEKLKNTNHIFAIGRGLQYATAMEAALKIKEVSYIHAEAFAGGELKHGTIALIEKGTPCIVFVSKENEKEIISNAIEIKSRGGYIIGISSENNPIFDFWLKVPEANSILTPICQIIPIQILAYQLAILKNLDPDHPRNLAKSVTVK